MRCAYALRRSVCIAFADEAFAKWLAQPVEAQELNGDAEINSDTLRTLVQEGKPSIRQGGHIVRRSHGRVIVEPREGWPSPARSRVAHFGGREIGTGWLPTEAQNAMTKSLRAKRGREFEFDRFRHDEGRPPRFLWMKRRIKDSRWVGRSSAASDRRFRQNKHKQFLQAGTPQCGACTSRLDLGAAGGGR